MEIELVFTLKNLGDNSSMAESQKSSI